MSGAAHAFIAAWAGIVIYGALTLCDMIEKGRRWPHPLDALALVLFLAILIAATVSR